MLNEFIVKDADGKLVLTRMCGGCGPGGKTHRDGSFRTKKVT